MRPGSGSASEEDLRILDAKVKQLKLEYEQYFLGSRPREPAQLRGEIQKQISIYSNEPQQNTAARFKFNSIASRFMAFKRQWDDTLRKMEAGTYERHVFRANLRERERAASPAPPKRRGSAAAASGENLFESYCQAARSCGQDVKNLTPEKLQAVIAKQEKAIRKKHGCPAVSFRIVVDGDRVKVKASPVRKPA